MSNRLVGTIVAGALVVVAAAGAVVLARSDGAYAFQVGRYEASQSSVNDELQALAENTVLRRIDEQARQQNPQTQPLSSTDGSVTIATGAGWLSLRVAQEVASQDVARRGLDATGADHQHGRALAASAVGGIRAFNAMPRWFRDALVRRWTDVAILQRELLADPTPALQQEISGLCPSGRYVSHILVATEQEAATIKQRLDEGGDFADLARASSIDTGSAQQGGALGCLDPSQPFVEPFATVAATQPVGVASDPFQTEFGFHVVLVSDQPAPEQLDQVTIGVILGRARGSKVEVDPRYGIWDRKNGQVLPPAVPTP